ncbi:Bromo-adjacent homology domain containing protein [Klebsormidium nitens]|uniref:Bromo-adjacent homology domain containing protein n=1 Tax=Klebsormidium nitens TaxID=105231 RepID=A0A1Y1HNW8_KLENI|nr:Bromo-adjacent homology domain containing protein [Klebsormidium nitens]|eukprot:GAQ80345.1 Bromo-adjacent homology domain containing protein [Klebsormidium nitens]
MMKPFAAVTSQSCNAVTRSSRFWKSWFRKVRGLLFRVMGDVEGAKTAPPQEAKALNGGDKADNDDDVPEAVPLGRPIKEEDGRKFYNRFEYEGTEFKSLDTVTLNPDEGSPDTPYFALIKDIWKEEEDEVYMTIQWFYRPDEAKRRNGELYPIRRKNELFYSFHMDDVPAGSVFHKVPIHVIRHTKSSAGIPESEYFVHRVYDNERKKLRDLEDEEFEDPDKIIIGMLIGRAEAALGDLPDASEEELAISSLSEKRPSSGASIEDVEEEPNKKRRKSGQQRGHANPNGAGGKMSEQERVLGEHGALTGDTARDKSMGVLLKDVGPSPGASEGAIAVHIGRLQELEQAAFEAKGNDRRAYSALLRHLKFNLKHEGTLRRRFFAGELPAEVVVRMDPNELKEGYTAEETRAREPVAYDPEPIEMVDKTCSLCGKRQVGVKDIIAGGKGQIYQLECLSCGHTFTTPEADIVKVTAGPVDPLKHEKDAPSASMKFSNVEAQMEAQEELLGGYREERIHPPGAAVLPEEVAGGQGRRAAEMGSGGSAFKESNALKNPADTELGGPQAGGRLGQAAVHSSGT